MDENSISSPVCIRYYLAKNNKAKIETHALLLSIMKIFSFRCDFLLLFEIVFDLPLYIKIRYICVPILNEKIFTIDSKMASVSIFALLFFAK